jgi:hypothetical protein
MKTPAPIQIAAKVSHLEKTSVQQTLTAAQLAARWHVTPMTLRRWRAAGRLPALHVGPRRIVFSLADVEKIETQSRA